MPSKKKPAVPQYRSSAAMWAFAVLMYAQQLREEADDHVAAYVDAATRTHYAKASEADRQLLRDHAAQATRVLTVAAAWRLTLARYALVHAAAQLLKCVVELGEAAPKLADQDLIRLLWNIDDHWEDADGPSMTALLKRCRDERPTRVVFSNFRIEIGGLQIQDVVRWANDVDKFVRAEADGDRMPLLHPDDLLNDD